MNKHLIHLSDGKKILLFLTFTFFLTLPHQAQSYLGIHETADILPPGQSRVGFIPQLDIANGRGLDASVFLDLFAGQDLNTRFEIGSGVTDFWAAGALKWSPFPDHGQQPAIGFRGKFIYARDLNTNFYNTQIAAMLSKRYQSSNGLFIPYAGLPLTFVYESSTRNFRISQLCFGTEWVINPDFQVGGEFQMSLENASNTLSAYLNFQFDEKIGFKK